MSTRRTSTLNAVFLIVLMGTGTFNARIEATEKYDSNLTAESSYYIQKFTSSELRTLLAPIALYPDALLAQIFPASSYPLQIAEANRYIQTRNTAGEWPPDVNWDSSVIALMNYPSVLKLMGGDLRWTEQLGTAVTYQMDDVMATVQQLRTEALGLGNLASNDKQTVIRDGDTIQIVPANPDIIYVPKYDPDVVYVLHPRGNFYVEFDLGLPFGLWLSNRLDWHRHRVEINRHWNRGGWVPTPRPYLWNPPSRQIPRWYLEPRFRSPGPPVRAMPHNPSNPRNRGNQHYTPPGNRPGSRRHSMSVRPDVEEDYEPVHSMGTAEPALADIQALPAQLFGLANSRLETLRAAERGRLSRSGLETQVSKQADDSENFDLPDANQVRMESERGAYSRRLEY